MNQKQVTISGEVEESVRKFCSKHGIIRKHFLDEAAIRHLEYYQKVVNQK